MSPPQSGPHRRIITNSVKSLQAFRFLKFLSPISYTGDALTVFAPTNEAFAKIPKKDLDALLANKTKLANVLKYHVVMKTWWSSALKDGKTLDTACTMCGGEKLTVNINNGELN